MEKTTEQYIDHEVRIRLHDIIYKQQNRKLNIIMGTCGAMFTTVLIPIFIHYWRMV